MNDASQFSIGLSEVALGVEDVTASANFYEKVVGLVPEKVESDFAFLWAGEPGHVQRVILLSRELPPLGQRNNPDTQTPRPSETSRLGHLGPALLGPTHFALHVPRERMLDAVDHVKKCGVEVWGPVDFGGEAIAYYFLDPDENWLEFYSPTPHEA